MRINMHYLALIKQEGDATLAEFPDCPGCQTFVRDGQSKASLHDTAREALEGWIEATLAGGEDVIPPSDQLPVPEGAQVLAVEVPAKLAIKVRLRAARKRAGLSQAEVAERSGLTTQQVAAIEDPDSDPTIDTIERAARALGSGLEITLIAARPA